MLLKIDSSPFPGASALKHLCVIVLSLSGSQSLRVLGVPQWYSPMLPLVGNICTNLITNGTIGKEIGANGQNGNTIGTNCTNVTNQWYRWENPEHTLCCWFL